MCIRDRNTYGTGCFLLMNTGDTICRSQNGLISTIGISLNGKVEYALEGSVFVGGAVIQWVRDGLRMIQESRDAEYYAQKVPDNGGIYIVPAFTGLGAPYGDMYARGAIVGITRGTTQNHIIRAAEESIAYQSAEMCIRDRCAPCANAAIRADCLHRPGLPPTCLLYTSHQVLPPSAYAGETYRRCGKRVFRR